MGYIPTPGPLPGEQWKPNNSDIGHSFLAHECGNCARDKAMREGCDIDECDDNEKCEIIGASFRGEAVEWRRLPTGEVKCIAFVPAGDPIPPQRDDRTLDMFELPNRVKRLLPRTVALTAMLDGIRSTENDMKVSEIEGEQLNAMVAKALGWEYDDRAGFPRWKKDGELMFAGIFSPATEWAQGGPIIEREKIELIHYGTDGYQGPWEAQIGCDTHYIDQGPGDAIGGPTPLVAAMRAFVAAKLGEEVPSNASFSREPERSGGESAGSDS